MLSNLKQDFARLCAYRDRSSFLFLLDCLLFDNGFQAVVLHRTAHWFKSLGIPVMAPVLARFSISCTGVDINPRASVGAGLVISHGVGIVIGAGAQVGSGLLIHHQVTIGAPTPSRIAAMPVIGNDVVIGAGAKVIGEIRVGDRSFVGANTLVTEDVPPGCKVTAPAPRTES